MNFPISTKTNEVDVMITWQEHPFRSLRNGQTIAGRKLKEHFIFKETTKNHSQNTRI